MIVYNGPYLIIKHEQENSRLINTWEFTPPNDFSYLKELTEHLRIVKKTKPSQIIWHIKL